MSMTKAVSLHCTLWSTQTTVEAGFDITVIIPYTDIILNLIYFDIDGYVHVIHLSHLRL